MYVVGIVHSATANNDAESVNSSVRPGQLQMAEDERLSRTEYLKLLQAQISSHELAKNLAVSREDFVLAAELKDTVERLKQQHASLSSGMVTLCWVPTL